MLRLLGVSILFHDKQFKYTMTSVKMVYKNTWNVHEFLWSIIKMQRKSAPAGGCPRSLHYPLQNFSGKDWGALAWREQRTPEWHIQALYNLELTYPPESLYSALANESNGMMDLRSTRCNVLLPSQEDSLTIISIRPTWPSSAAWCKGEAFTSSQFFNLFCFFTEFCKPHALPSKTTWKYIQNCYLK